MYLTVINESREMGCTCEPTRTLATLFIYYSFSGLKSVCCQLSQLLWPSFQNNTFNSGLSLIIHSSFFFFGKLLVSSYMRKTGVNLFIVPA